MVAVATVAFTLVGPVGKLAGRLEGWHDVVIVEVAVVIVVAAVVVAVTLVRKMASLKRASARKFETQARTLSLFRLDTAKLAFMVLCIFL